MNGPERPVPRLGIALALLAIGVLAAGSLYFASQAELDLPVSGGADEGVAGTDVSVEDIGIDPTTRLPLVPLPDPDGRIAWLEEPEEPLDVNARFTSATLASTATVIEPAPATGTGTATEIVAATAPSTVTGDLPLSATGEPEPLTADRGRSRQVSLLASFEDHDSALAVGQELAAAVGDPIAEAAWLEAAGQDPGAGFGWLGEASAGAPFVQVLDRWLLVGGLEHQARLDPLRASPPEGGPAYQSPLTQALADKADEVLVEGDRGREGAVAFELVCRGDQARLLSLSQDLADQDVAPFLQPPWVEPGIDEVQRRARRTARLLQQLGITPIVERMRSDPGLVRLQQNYQEALSGGDEERIEEASARLTEYVELLVAESWPDLGSLEERLDPVVLGAALGVDLGMGAEELSELVLAPGSPAPPGDQEVEQIVERLGVSTAEPELSGDAQFRIVTEGGSLGLFRGRWSGVAQGLLPLVDYLGASGCDELAIEFHDGDAAGLG